MSRVLSARIVAVESVTPGMRRLVVAGADLAAFRVPSGALGPYLKIHLRDAGGRDVLRTYSVRRHDPDRSEITIDVVVHPAGPGGLLAAAARPGDPIRLSGPGYIPAPPCGHYLLAGDQTALPAIGHILETLPAGVRVEAVVEVASAEEEQPLPAAAGHRITWLRRAAGAESRLVEALGDLWPGDDRDTLVFAGAEARLARRARFHARTVRGMPAARCLILNYWNAGKVEGAFSYVA